MAIVSKLFSRNSKPTKPILLPELLAEPQASKELSRALTEIEQATEYVQSYLRILDSHISDLTAKRAMVSNSLKDALGHKLASPEPEVLSASHFRDASIERAQTMAAAPDLGVLPTSMPTRHAGEVFSSQAKAKARLTQMGEAMIVAAQNKSEASS